MDMGWHPKDGFLVRKIREGWCSEYGSDRGKGNKVRWRMNLKTILYGWIDRHWTMMMRATVIWNQMIPFGILHRQRSSSEALNLK